ncbi:MAG: hypothetical protein OEY14_07955 [Myxococcales bacterium]|nr:hypothetical protein [Myxococcales bacterium]
MSGGSAGRKGFLSRSLASARATLGAVLTLGAALSLGAALASGCGASAPPRIAPAPSPTRGPLALLLPGGAEWVIEARPAALFSDPDSARVLSALLSEESLDLLDRRTGIRLHEVSELVYATYPDGAFLLLLRSPSPARDVVRAAELRMNTVSLRAEEPFLRRGGHLGTERWELAALDARTLAAGGGRGGPMAQLIHRVARGGWPQGQRPAISPEARDAARAIHGEAPLLLFGLRPLELPPGPGLSLLLARQRSLRASAGTEEPGQLTLRLELRGEFPRGAPENFRQGLRSIAETDFGMALGIRAGLESLAIETHEDFILLRMRLPAEILGRGLRLLFFADIRDLLRADSGGAASP